MPLPSLCWHLQSCYATPICPIAVWPCRVIPCRLLQRGFRWGTKDYYRQIATSVECCSTCCQRHPEVWSWPVTDYAYRASLAGRFWTNQLQTWYAHVPMPAQQSSSVPDGPLHISIRRCLLSTASFCQFDSTALLVGCSLVPPSTERNISGITVGLYSAVGHPALQPFDDYSVPMTMFVSVDHAAWSVDVGVSEQSSNSAVRLSHNADLSIAHAKCD